MALIYSGLRNGKKVYKGISGTEYQYDLTNPIDKQAYLLDIDAQMRDKLSLNFYRKTENGGGIYE